MTLTKFVRNNNTLASKLHKETVMVDVDLGQYFSLNPVASEIWVILEKPLSEERIVVDLMGKYDVELEVCRTEVLSFLNKMTKLGLIHEVS